MVVEAVVVSHVCPKPTSAQEMKSRRCGRYRVNSLVDWFLVWWLRSGRYGWSRLRRRLFERRYLKKELPEAESLEEIEARLKDVRWTEDGPLHLFDCISYPQMTWAKKKDDCDGFSVLAAELLNRWNADCNPALVTALVRPVKKSHTICAFNSPQGALCYFDNDELHRGSCEKYADIVEIIKGSHKLVCWDVRNPFTFKMLDFHTQKN